MIMICVFVFFHLWDDNVFSFYNFRGSNANATRWSDLEPTWTKKEWQPSDSKKNLRQLKPFLVLRSEAEGSLWCSRKQKQQFAQRLGDKELARSRCFFSRPAFQMTKLWRRKSWAKRRDVSAKFGEKRMDAFNQLYDISIYCTSYMCV